MLICIRINTHGHVNTHAQMRVRGCTPAYAHTCGVVFTYTHMHMRTRFHYSSRAYITNACVAHQLVYA